MTDRLDRIKAILDRMAQDNNRRAAQSEHRFAALDAQLDRIDRQIAENSSEIGELTAQSKTNMLAIGAFTESNMGNLDKSQEKPISDNHLIAEL